MGGPAGILPSLQHSSRGHRGAQVPPPQQGSSQEKFDNLTRKKGVVVVNAFLTSTTVVLNHFAEGSQIQTYEFLESRTKKFYHKTIDTFCFIALTKSVTQNFRGVTERYCLSKGILSQQRFGH